MSAEENMLAAAVGKVEVAARFLSSPILVAQLVEGMQAAVIRVNSPWLNRKDAAEYARCSPSEIDRAAAQGFFKKYARGGTPLFRREELDAAIAGGTWLQAGGTKIEQQSNKGTK